MKLFKHLHTITKHRHKVIKHCAKVGIFFQGLFHDISKLSPTEFIPSVKYYQGTRSPNERERELFGYSKLFSQEGLDYAKAIIKIIGAGYVFGIGADICRELGEVGVGSAVLVAGRIEIFAITLPYFKKILDIGAELLL